MYLSSRVETPELNPCRYNIQTISGKEAKEHWWKKTVFSINVPKIIGIKKQGGGIKNVDGEGEQRG